MSKKISQLTPKVLPVNDDVVPINNQGTTKKTPVFNLKNNLFARMYSEGGELPPNVDPFWDNTVLLLHGDGANNAQNNTFLDSSSNNNALTRNGTPSQGSFSPFALNGVAYSPTLHGGSGYFNGTTDYLSNYTSGAATATTFGTQNFTIEAWVNFNSATGNQGICDASNQIGTGPTTGQFFFYKSTTSLIFGNHIIGNILTYTWNPVAGTWYHVVVSRSGTSLKMFINGVEVASVTNSTNFVGSGINIGVVATPYYFNGYISNLRVTKGLAVYTSNFTPPTSPVTLTSNGGATPSTAPTSGQVSLLCNFTNGGIIDHTEKNVLTTGGSTKVSTSVVKYGSGSMHFAADGDFLTIPTNTNLNLSTTFTVECWLYRTSSSTGMLLDVRRGTNEVGYIAIENNTIKVTLTSPSALLYSASTIALNTWTHVAFVSDSNGSRIYINGTQDATTPTVSNWLGVNRPLYIGNAYHYTSPSTPYYGYIDDYRITKGIARYTSNFTPPTRAFPDVPGTASQQNLPAGDLGQINLTGVGKWFGGALATNGKIYATPFSSDSVLIINPITNTATTTNFGLTLTGSSKWAGNVLAPNGKIYGIPTSSSSVLVIDPATNTVSTFGSLGTGNKWNGGTLAPNGRIYGIPYNSTSILVIDPVTNTTSTFGSLTGNLKWNGGVLAPNGRIYGIPYDNTSVLIIDPVTNTTSTIGSLAGAAKWQGGVLAPNGRIYGIPCDSTSVLIIDPTSNSVTTTAFGLTLTGGLKWIGGVLGTNRKIYGIPHNSASILVIDPITNTATTTNFGLSLSDLEKWVGGVLGTNGKIYGVPYTSTAVLQITPAINNSVNIPTERCISAYYNKF